MYPCLIHDSLAHLSLSPNGMPIISDVLRVQPATSVRNRSTGHALSDTSTSTALVLAMQVKLVNPGSRVTNKWFDINITICDSSKMATKMTVNKKEGIFMMYR